MKSVRIVTDIDECRSLWKQVIPAAGISDVWDVRACFHRQYRHTPFFVVCEDRSGVCGLLPLVWNEEVAAYHFFPGETWSGKTWIEQNHLVAPDSETLNLMLSVIPGSYHLRYLAPSEPIAASLQTVDEIGYYFVPPTWEYSMDRYFESFSHKFAKRLRKEVDAFYQRGVEFRINHLRDFDLMIDMNLSRYGDQSYFYDDRFRGGFQSLFKLLKANGWLRLVSVSVDGQPAAVDLGCVYGDTYTLLAGGTNAAFPGIAKLINLHHMQWACEQQLSRADFLCGDFNWKTMFHLEPQPLYVMANEQAQPERISLPAAYVPPVRLTYGMRRSSQIV